MIKSKEEIEKDLSSDITSSAAILHAMAVEISDYAGSRIHSQQFRIFWGGIAGSLGELSQKIRDRESRNS